MYGDAEYAHKTPPLMWTQHGQVFSNEIMQPDKVYNGLIFLKPTAGIKQKYVIGITLQDGGVRICRSR